MNKNMFVCWSEVHETTLKSESSILVMSIQMQAWTSWSHIMCSQMHLEEQKCEQQACKLTQGGTQLNKTRLTDHTELI